jgi:hypothetical protein
VDCTGIHYGAPCEDADGDDICDDVDDCVGAYDECGVCNGENADMDECGECFGSGYADNCGTCDDDASNDCVQDCNGDWGGSAFEDECGICDGPGAIYECGCEEILEGACDCDGNFPVENYDCAGNCIVDIDCNGDCGGSAFEDDCGVCEGDNSTCTGCMDFEACNYDDTATITGDCYYPDPGFNCDGECVIGEDCEGVCGGSAEIDECGVCAGEGIADGACDCDGNVVDDCGECGGDNSSCTGCMDSGALNYDANATLECENCCEFAPNYPFWEVDIPSYEFSGAITAQVLIDDILFGQLNTDLLAAFVGDEIRGVTYGNFFPPADYNVFNLLVYSNETIGESITFKYYDSQEDAVYDISETIPFESNMILGNAFTPEYLTVSSSVETNISFSVGWNWFSVNVVDVDMSLTTVLSSLGDAGIFIKDQSSFSDYYAGWGWFGTLNEISNETFYMIGINSESTLNFSGMPVDPSEPISLSTGWNWISYKPQTTIDINTALGSISTGIFIKDQSSFSDFYAGWGWFGTLNEMSPGSGYMLRMDTAEDLVYPSGGLLSTETDNYEVSLTRSEDCEVNPFAYEFNGAITAHVSIGDEVVSDGTLLAYVGDECRGEQEALYFPPAENYYFPTMTYSNVVEGEVMTFKYVDVSQNVYDLDGSLEFVSDMIVGNGFDPIVFTTTLANESVTPESYELGMAYPNPFNPSTTLDYNLASAGDVNIVVFDMLGNLVEQLYSGYHSQGTGQVIWDAKDTPAGIYFIRLSAGNYSQTRKVILMK